MSGDKAFNRSGEEGRGISSPLHSWLLAIRPRTLPASVTPVIVGSGAAYADHHFRAMPAFAALLGSLLLQIGVNLANDYFDYVHGFDTEERVGPVRVTQAGLLAPGKVRAAMLLTFALVACTGIYLTVEAGWPIFMAGTASILAALMYSGGPYPLSSHGLGDLFVFLFFGLVAVCGTYYVQALRVTPLVVATAVPVGLLITAILVVNNLRDRETDERVGKRTLAVMLGEKATRMEFLLLVMLSYLTAGLVRAMQGPGMWTLLPLVSLPLAWKTATVVMHSDGPVLNGALASTARLSLVYGMLLAAGLALSA